MRRGLSCVVIGLMLGCSDGDAAPVSSPGLQPVQGDPPAATPGSQGTPMSMTPTDMPGQTPAEPGPAMDGLPEVQPNPGPGGDANPGDDGTAGSPAGDGDGDATQDPVVEPPQTCDAGLSGQAGRETVRMDHDGVSRNYILHVPDSYDPTSPTPLVLYFHPLLTSATTASSSSGFRELADREGFIVAFPDSAQSAAWNVGGVCCTSSPDIDDVGFARAIVDDIRSSYCVDNKRIYASGFSMGGGMTHHLGCEAADVFAAIAPGAFDLFEESPCAPARPLTVIAFRGTADAIVPYDGGLHTSAPNGFRGNHTFEGAEDSFARWAEINGCTGQPADQGGGCQTHTECTDGVEVTLCTAVGGGHSWPDADRAWETLSRFVMP